MEFENKNYEGIYYTRFIASYIKSCKQTNHRFIRWEFMDWLRSLTINGKKMPEEVIKEIEFLADNGKLELEDHSYKWLKERA